MPKQQNISSGLNEIIGFVPNWITRFGAILSLLVILTLALVAYYVKYPNIYLAKGFISNGSGPAVIYAPSSGYINILVKNGSTVSQNQAVAYLGTKAQYSEYQKRKALLEGGNSLNVDSAESLNDFIYELKDWEEKRLIKSPIAGKLSYLHFFQEGFFVSRGQKIFGISSKNFTNLEARVYLPISISKHISTDHKVQIILSDLPVDVNITSTGFIDSITSFPTTDFEGRRCYLMTVKLEENFIRKNKEILIKYDYWGIDAKIISDDITILNRIISGIKN